MTAPAPAHPGLYLTNSGVPAAPRQRFPRAPPTPQVSSSGPLFTGASTVLAEMRVVRLTRRGCARELSPVAVRASGDAGFFGASSTAHEERLLRRKDWMEGEGKSFVFSGADGAAHEKRLLRYADARV